MYRHLRHNALLFAHSPDSRLYCPMLAPALRSPERKRGRRSNMGQYSRPTGKRVKNNNSAIFAICETTLSIGFFLIFKYNKNIRNKP